MYRYASFIFIIIHILYRSHDTAVLDVPNNYFTEMSLFSFILIPSFMALLDHKSWVRISAVIWIMYGTFIAVSNLNAFFYGDTLALIDILYGTCICGWAFKCLTKKVFNSINNLSKRTLLLAFTAAAIFLPILKLDERPLHIIAAHYTVVLALSTCIAVLYMYAARRLKKWRLGQFLTIIFSFYFSGMAIFHIIQSGLSPNKVLYLLIGLSLGFVAFWMGKEKHQPPHLLNNN